MKKNNTVALISEIAIMAAIGFILDELQGLFFKGIFTAGGSIGFAMIAVLIVAYRRGLFPAIFVGLIMGIFDIATSAYILSPVQMLLDYILPYAVVGIAGIFKPFFDNAQTKGKRILFVTLGTLLGAFLKFLSHYFAGVAFWVTVASDLWGMNGLHPYLYSFIYNIAFIGPSALLCLTIMIVLILKAPQLFIKAETNEKVAKEDTRTPYFAPTLMVISLLFFSYFLFKYIKSYSSYLDGDAFGFEFNGDYLIIFVLSLLVFTTTLVSYVGAFKGVSTKQFESTGLTLITASSFAYGVARLIKMLQKEKPTEMYWMWVILSLIIFVLIINYYFIKSKIKETD